VRNEKPKHKRPTPEELDERLVIPLDPETAIEAILKVDPESEPDPDSDQNRTVSDS
jgi:hypothetical protein